jgi:hypothetical protein
MIARQGALFFLVVLGLQTVVMYGYESIKAAVSHNKHLHMEIR